MVYRRIGRRVLYSDFGKSIYSESICIRTVPGAGNRFMNWFDKILARKNTPDDSRELKKGEVKELLINSFRIHLPDFEFVLYKNSTYYFQRIRHSGPEQVFETLNIIFGLKDKMFSCSVASTVIKSYLYTSTYNNGFLVGHADLLVIKRGSGASNIEDSYYWHNGKIATVEKVIHEIASDIKSYGLSYLDKRLKRLGTHALVQHGLALIRRLTVDKQVLKNEIETDRKNAGYTLSQMKHPLYIELRDQLQGVPGQTKEDRQEIMGLTLELIEYYYENK